MHHFFWSNSIFSRVKRDQTNQQPVELTLPSPALHLTLQINSKTIQGKIVTMFWLQLMTKYKHTSMHHYIRISVTSVAADVLRLVSLTPFVHVLQVTMLTLCCLRSPRSEFNFADIPKQREEIPTDERNVHRPQKLRAKTCSPALLFLWCHKGHQLMTTRVANGVQNMCWLNILLIAAQYQSNFP